MRGARFGGGTGEKAFIYFSFHENLMVKGCRLSSKGH